MADEENAETPMPPVVATSSNGETSNTHFKLPSFWPQNPGLWCIQVECILANRKVMREFNCYCLVVEALPHDSHHLVADLVEQVLAADPYTTL
jgi:hypothetical protein